MPSSPTMVRRLVGEHRPAPVRPAVAALLLALLAAASGCVKRSEHEAALADLQQSRTQAAALGRDLDERQAELAALRRELQSLQAAMQERDRRLADAAAAQAERERQLEELSALNAELGDRLRQAGQSVEQLAAERTTLADALAEARRHLEELRRQQAAAEARAAQFQQLLAAFRRLMDAGRLAVVLRDGRMLIELPNDVLFDSGRAELKPEGKRTLAEVAQVLARVRDRHFRVAGHTDDVQIASGRFPSNWELSTARAVAVVKLLVERGVRPANLSAAGYGEFAPAASNATAEGRAKNRRIEIELVPDLAEMVKLPERGPPPGPAPASS